MKSNAHERSPARHATTRHRHPFRFSRFIPGLSVIAEGYDAFILDIFGVLHNGVELYSGTIIALNTKANGNHLPCLNTPRLDGIIEDLDAIGLLQTLYDDIVAAGDSTRAKLQPTAPAMWLLAGIERFHALFEGIDIITDNIERADFILNAIRQQDKEVPHIRKSGKPELPAICRWCR